MKLRSLIISTIAIAALGLLIIACGGGSDNSNAFKGRDPSVAFSDVCTKSAEKQFSQPDVIIDTNKTYTATITLAKGGDIVLELFSDVPITTNNFVFLSCKGFYDGLTFHRVLQDFMAQGGDPLGTGTGGPGYAIPDEDDGKHTFAEAGAISMAKSGPDTTGSQFFITFAPETRLDPDFTVFGKVTAGMDVLKQITLRDPDQSPTFTGDAIATITINEQ